MASDLPSLVGKVCIVTGASRGIGKGVALVLAKAGATVYITGRTFESVEGERGSLKETAEEIGQTGMGQCIPVKCDHGNDDEVKQLFDRVEKEQNGRLDILVNNAFAGVRAIFENYGKPFYEQPLSMWDDINRVGPRSNYIAAHHAARLMAPAKQGLIVNISSCGGLIYLFNVAYGVGKAANDRLAADMAVELRKQNVACVSLWPGPVKTEVLSDLMEKSGDDEKAEKGFEVFKHPEDATFTGKAIAWLATDTNLMKKSGRVLIVAELAKEYGYKDVGGAQPRSVRQAKYWVQKSYPSLAWLVPEFVQLPGWLVAAATHRL